MTPKKTILRELSRIEAERGPGEFTRPTAISGFNVGDPKHTAAVNQLLQDRLIEGVKAPEGGLAIALNQGRRQEVSRALRPWFFAGKVWVPALALAVTAVATLFL